MELAYHAAQGVSIALFAFYGWLCLFADGMAREFERFGLSRFRRLTGGLELLGAVGLGLGYFLPNFTLLSATGLTALMILGVVVRFRAGDSHLAADWQLAPSWRLSFDADGLAGGPGRAVDASLKLGFELGDGWALRAGYRTLEGGADVEEVYSFAWLHSAVLSVAWRP
jgi:hypothetical protein